MSKFQISFIVDAKYLGDMMTELHAYKLEDLAFKVVAGSSPKVRPDGAKAWEVVASIASEVPRPMDYFKKNLLSKGFKIGTVYNALTTACERKVLVKKMIDGRPHYHEGKK